MTENNSPLERLLDWCAGQVASIRLSEKRPSTGEIDDEEVRQEIEQVEADMRAVERDHRSLVDAYGAAVQELQRLGAKSVPLTPSTARLRDLLGGYECPKCGGSGRIPVIDLGVGEVIDKVPCPVCRPDDTPRRDALEALDEIVPELEFGRGTHVQWREYLQQHPDGEKRNPECGDADFHAKMVEVYDKRLDAINKARRALTAPPTVPEMDSLLDVMTWADEILGALGTEYASRVTEEEARIAHAIAGDGEPAVPEAEQQPVAFQFGKRFQYVANHWPPENCNDPSVRPLYAAPPPVMPEAVVNIRDRLRADENQYGSDAYEQSINGQIEEADRNTAREEICRDYADELDRALAQTQSQQGGEAVRIPEGWKLVPDHSTVEWADNLEKIARKGGYDTVIDGVLAAAPEPDERNDNGQ